MAAHSRGIIQLLLLHRRESKNRNQSPWQATANHHNPSAFDDQLHVSRLSAAKNCQNSLQPKALHFLPRTVFSSGLFWTKNCSRLSIHATSNHFCRNFGASSTIKVVPAPFTGCDIFSAPTSDGSSQLSNFPQICAASTNRSISAYRVQ